jgi:hypothetical protein
MDIASTCRFGNLTFDLLAASSTCHFINLPLIFFWFQLLVNFYLQDILSTCRFGKLTFDLLAASSTCHFINLPLIFFWFQLLEIFINKTFRLPAVLATWHLINLLLCQPAILPT